MVYVNFMVSTKKKLTGNTHKKPRTDSKHTLKKAIKLQRRKEKKITENKTARKQLTK